MFCNKHYNFIPVRYKSLQIILITAFAIGSVVYIAHSPNLFLGAWLVLLYCTWLLPLVELCNCWVLSINCSVAALKSNAVSSAILGFGQKRNKLDPDGVVTPPATCTWLLNRSSVLLYLNPPPQSPWKFPEPEDDKSPYEDRLGSRFEYCPLLGWYLHWPPPP